MSVIQEIEAERQKQIAKGFTALHDDQHWNQELEYVALDILRGWRDSWGVRERHIGDRRQQLLIAAALIVAEIERRDRAEKAGAK